MRILLFLIVIVLAIIAITAGVSSSTDHLARAKEAQAAIEANRTAQIATSGLAVNSVLMSLLVGFLVLVIVGLVGLSGYLAWRNAQRVKGLVGDRLPAGKWAAGPNARWGRVGGASPVERLPGGTAADPMQQMVQLMMLKYLSEMGAQAGIRSADNQVQPRLDGGSAEEDDDLVMWR